MLFDSLLKQQKDYDAKELETKRGEEWNKCYRQSKINTIALKISSGTQVFHMNNSLSSS